MRYVKNYVNGEWIEPEVLGYVDIENPSTGAVIGKCPLSTGAEVQRAVNAAVKAFSLWKDVPVSRRVQPIDKLVEMIRANEEKLSRMIAEEMGKSLPDARAEVKRALENCEVACGMTMLQQGDKLIGASHEIDGELLRLSLGVFGMLAPFNFPLMVPFWFLPYAIASGNTFVLKASERVPLTMQMMTEFIHQIGLPPGVFNLVNGNQVAGEALIESPDVQGISLVGRSQTCRMVAEKCARANKRYQAMGSAKNHLVVMEDANMEEAIRNMVSSCYGCAGQRCMASSAIIVIGDRLYKHVCDAFVEASRKVLVADPLAPEAVDEPMVMGPVISSDARSFILNMIEAGIREGASLALDGRDIRIPGREKGYFIGPTVFTDVRPGMEIHKTEIFGPVVVMLRADSLDEAITIINEHEYGNGASIYTQSGYRARKFKLEVQCGMIGINVGIPAPVAYLPFGGMKASQFADIKAQGRAVINFFTEDKIITERYWA